MDALLLALQALSRCRSLESIGQSLCHSARQLTGADGAVLTLRDGDNCHFVSEDAVSPYWVGRRLPVSTSINGWVMQHRFPAIIPDIDQDARVPRVLRESGVMKSLAIFPAGNNQTAALGTYWHQRHDPSPEALYRLQALADAAAIALENAALDAAQERRLEERKAELESAYGELRKSLEAEKSAREAAENATRAKADFLAMVSHEIRTPLNGVMGLNTLLLETALTPEQRMFAEMARFSGDALLHLLNDVLDLSRIETGRLEIETLEFNPQQIARETLHLMLERAERKGLVIESDIADDTNLLLRGDSGRLGQVLLTLLGNAIKFTDSGKVCLRCMTTPASNRHQLWLRFEVQDEGRALAPETLARLFATLTGDRQETPQHFGGTGFSLAISRRLTELMGGRIGLNAGTGHGNLFWLEIPFERVSLAHSIELPDLHDIGKPGLNARVLLAEDNSINQLVARKMLDRLGCTVDVVKDGTAAIEAARRRHYDLIFLDCHMPGMDGPSTSRALRALNGSRRIPVIALTASALKGERERCLDAGMDDYLTKPLRLAELASVVQSWLQKAAH
jgi:two-component system CheB/CheR fusion protein